ncbi:MAG: hypothetical protein V2B18_17800 [Pseudomonadota bacterium]
MKRVWSCVILLCLWVPGNLTAQGLPQQVASPAFSLSENVKVNPYAQIGFQWVGSNLNLPVRNETLTNFLNIGDMDISLKDANFWTGTAGVNVTVKDMYSFFAAAGGLMNRPFLTAATVPVSLDAFSTSANLEFTNTNVESWFVQTGVGVGPILLGLYWDHFAFALGDPRNSAGPIANQTLKGDILTKTFSPFIGIALPASGALLTVTYSPWAYSNTALALTSSRNNVSELRYTWNKPGDLFNAMLQYNTPVSSSSTFGLWCNYSHMKMGQDAELEFVNAPVPTVERTRSVNATMTKYVYGAGITLGVDFRLSTMMPE